MGIPHFDEEYLIGRRFSYSVGSEANMICLVISDLKLPDGYNQAKSDLLLRLNPGYPDVAPDMWWFNPAIVLADGRIVRATEARETHLGKTWQRWSRHFTPGQWKSGIDSLESFLALVQKELQRCVICPTQ